MLCSFELINKSAICNRCGRSINFDKNSKFLPVAKCRVPEHVGLKLGYLYNKKIKGVGDTLAIFIKKLNYSYPNLGSARAKLTMLNKKGINWCDLNKDLIYLWLLEECAIQGIVLQPKIGKALIRLAIIKAKNQEL